MKYDIAMKWADALESGTFEQAIGALKKCNKANCFCAQGVLLEISGLGFWDDTIYYKKGAILPYEYKNEDVLGAGWLTGYFREMVEAKTSLGTISDMNDDEKKSFKDIAAYIRKNWETL